MAARTIEKTAILLVRFVVAIALDSFFGRGGGRADALPSCLHLTTQNRILTGLTMRVKPRYDFGTRARLTLARQMVPRPVTFPMGFIFYSVLLCIADRKNKVAGKLRHDRINSIIAFPWLAC
jgi:hypothetical protein